MYSNHEKTFYEWSHITLEFIKNFEGTKAERYFALKGYIEDIKEFDYFKYALLSYVLGVLNDKNNDEFEKKHLAKVLKGLYDVRRFNA